MGKQTSLIVTNIRHVVILTIAHIAILDALLVLDCSQVSEGYFFRTLGCRCFLRLLLF